MDCVVVVRLADIGLADAAVFFEFKHYKPKKTKISVKCFCFMERDEFKKGTFPLEMLVLSSVKK